MATPFPWSERRLLEAGANAHFVSHPLLEIVKPSLTHSQFYERFGIDSTRPLIGLLPGSRPFEIDHNLPSMIGAGSLIQRELPEIQFVIGAGSGSARDRIQRVIASITHPRPGITEVSREIAQTVGNLDIERRKRTAPRMVTTEGMLVSLGDLDDIKRRGRQAQTSDSGSLPPFVIAQGLSYDVMAHSDAIIVCSGTATLEAAILGAPMVIIYRGSRLMEMEFKVRRIKVDHIGLPNIIADERIVPEFIQHDAAPEALSGAVLRYLRDPAYRAETKKRLLEVREALGTPGASARTADLVLKTADLD